MSETNQSKILIRKRLRETLAGMTEPQRHGKSVAACAYITASPEFRNASVVMVYLPLPLEVDVSGIALRAWQAGKTVCVSKVSWDQRRMLPTEIKSLTSGLTTSQHGVREPASGNPIPVDMIDMVIVPGLGFSEKGHRIGRGMGFYDRFLGQSEFLGVSCGVAFAEQMVAELPALDHDIPLAMLATDQGIRRFRTNAIETR